jgi:hypothetical protein
MRDFTTFSPSLNWKDIPMRYSAQAAPVLTGFIVFILFAALPLPFGKAKAARAIKCEASQCLECAEWEMPKNADRMWDLPGA